MNRRLAFVRRRRNGGSYGSAVEYRCQDRCEERTSEIDREDLDGKPSEVSTVREFCAVGVGTELLTSDFHELSENVVPGVGSFKNGAPQVAAKRGVPRRGARSVRKRRSASVLVRPRGLEAVAWQH